MVSKGMGGDREEGGETEAAFKERTGRGTALEVEIAMSRRLRKSGNRYHYTCAVVKEPRLQKGTGLCG